MPDGGYLLISNIFYSVVSSVEGATEAAREGTTAETIGGNNSLTDLLDTADDLSGVSTYLMDIMYILAIIVVCLAALTVFMYIYRYLVRRKNNYQKNDDDFLDN